MEKPGNVVYLNPLSRAGVISSGIVETTNPIFVANDAIHAKFKAELGDEDYKILTALLERGKNKDYEEFITSLSEKERSIFDRATKIRGGRRRTRRGNMLSMLYNKMTHTRKHRGGNEVPDYIVRKSLARIAENTAKNTARLEKLEKETKKKFRPVARHAAAVAREKSGHAAPYYTKKRGGGRRTRRNRK